MVGKSPDVNLDDTWFRAYESRDRRFDGVFFLGVTSTGIYCRPICPARTPRRENAVFFQSASQAEVAGYRPCKRCRPESAPNGQAPDTVPDEVRRAQHLITRGFLDDSGVEDLAGVVGLTSRHLRRLFTTHLGMSPRAVAQLQRLQIARRLLEQTALPVTQIAFEAGFRSVRAFNLRIRESFGVTPSSLRRAAADRSGAWTVLSLKIGYRPPYPWDVVRGRLQQEALSGTTAIGDTTLRKVQLLGHDVAVVGIEHLPVESSFRMSVHYRSSPDCSIRSFVTQAEVFLDCLADPLRLQQFFQHRIPDTSPDQLRLVGSLDPLEMAIREILRQRLSAERVTGYLERLTEHVDSRVALPYDLTHVFPNAQQLVEKFRRQSQQPDDIAIRQLSERVADGRISLAPAADPGRLQQQLTAVPGISPQTATTIAMRATGYPDVEVDHPEASSWRPWRSYGALLADSLVCH